MHDTAMNMPNGYGLRHLRSTDSTNAEARRLAARGETGPLWIVADEQTAGRGRRGRTWQTLGGNLFASLLLRPDLSLKETSLMVFAAGLAAREAVATTLPSACQVQCKWPNDVLIDGKKVAGILIESETAPDGSLACMAIGIGINVAAAPSGELLYPATSLHEAGGPADRDDVLNRLAVSLDAEYRRLRDVGARSLLEDWRRFAIGVGDRVTARLEDREITGIFEDLDEDGTLLIRLGDGSLERVVTGDIFHGLGR